MISLLTFKPTLYLLLPLAFLIGSIPFGILFTRGKGIDIRTMGSRNIGATNVLRSAGKMPAVCTLLGDIFKGALAVFICKLVIIGLDLSTYSADFAFKVEDLWLGITGLSAVAGHMFSIFLSFKGGKGVATGLGVLLIYDPAVAGIMLIVWIVVAVVSRISSLAAIIAVAAMPVLFILFGESRIKVLTGAVLALLIIYRHKSNIKNLLSGTESRIGSKTRIKD